MKNTNIQSSQNLIIIKGIKDDLEAIKAKAFHDNEHFFWEPNLIQDLAFEIDDLEKSFSVISFESEGELHYYVKNIRRQSLDLSNIAIQFPELLFSQVVIQSKDDSIKYIEYSKWSPGVEFELTIPAGFINWQLSFSAFSIANIEEIYLKNLLSKRREKFVCLKKVNMIFLISTVLISQRNYVQKYRDRLLDFIQNEQGLKNKLADFICEKSSPMKNKTQYLII